jgi:glyoxalase family protein
MELKGIHHLTAITADARGNHSFYTQSLGLRLVKKTVNQDDPSAYHLFYADGMGSPGTDITFFNWPVGAERRGTISICRTGFRVNGEKSFAYWSRRFTTLGIKHTKMMERDGRLTLDFEDHEGQRLSLVDDAGAGVAQVWSESPIPPEHQIRGLGPISISVPEFASTERLLTNVMSMTAERSYGDIHVYKMAGVGPVAELHVAVEPGLPRAGQGAGGVHHVAFNIPSSDYQAWTQRLKDMRIANSGPVDRFWFQSLYFHEPNGILFEIATDGPGFATDETLDNLGKTLSLPPFLEPRRAQIEAGLKPL